MKRLEGRLIIVILSLSLILSACKPGMDPKPSVIETETLIPVTPTSEPTPTETAEPTATSVILSEEDLVFCEPGEKDLAFGMRTRFLGNLPKERFDKDEENCIQIKAGDENKIGEVVLTLVAPFPTIAEEISLSELKDFWQGKASEHFETLLMFGSSYTALQWLWGEPQGNIEIFVETESEKAFNRAEEMMKQTWLREKTWAIVDFEDLHPRWKVIAINGQSPVHKAFSPEAYPLTIPLSLEHEDQVIRELAKTYLEQFPPLNNRDPQKLATVILTGVTAMVRATAVGMDERGITVPGEDLAPVLKEADILHISNEVPFAENCPPHTHGNYLVFCSPASYMELLRSIGTDIVELTGDHFQDYGSKGMLYTLDLYKKEGWPVYGGGKDIFEARKPVRLEVNGNKIAFLGCNAKSPNFAQASETSSGAYHCDMTYMAETVRELVEEGYMPIVTFQHEERYDWSPNAHMIEDFGMVLDSGAVIASGSQAHQPHFAEFVYDGFAHYGLGNFIFDQYGIRDYTDWAFIDRHVFYNGRHISTEILPIRFLDKVKATWATPEQRVEMLKVLFNTARMMWPGTKPWEQ